MHYLSIKLFKKFFKNGTLKMGGIFNNGNNMWTLARTQRLVGAQEALSRRQPGKLPASRAVQKLGPAGTGREGALPGSRPAVNG